MRLVVADDGQGVTTVVRGADLLESTARQIQLGRALGFPETGYAHLPVVVGRDGRKVGKRDGALPLESLDEREVRRTLRAALGALGQEAADGLPSEILARARGSFDPTRIPRGPVPLSVLAG